MPVKAVILVLLVLGGGVAVWQSRAGTPESPIDGVRSCLEEAPGFQVRESEEAKGARQLLVTTPSGSTSRSGPVTVKHEATVFLTFFESPEQAETWSSALEDMSTDTGAANASNEMIGTVFLDWSVEAPESERETVRGCVTA